MRRSLLGHLRLVIIPHKAEEKEALDARGPFSVAATQTSSRLGAGVERASSRVVVESKGRLDMRLDSGCCVSWSLEPTA